MQIILIYEIFDYFCSRMRIISHKKLKLFYEQREYNDAKVPLERWYDIACRRTWHSLGDIRQDYGDTDMVGNQKICIQHPWKQISFSCCCAIHYPTYLYTVCRDT